MEEKIKHAEGKKQFDLRKEQPIQLKIKDLVSGRGGYFATSSII